MGSIVRDLFSLWFFFLLSCVKSVEMTFSFIFLISLFFNSFPFQLTLEIGAQPYHVYSLQPFGAPMVSNSPGVSYGNAILSVSQQQQILRLQEEKGKKMCNFFLFERNTDWRKLLLFCSKRRFATKIWRRCAEYTIVCTSSDWNSTWSSVEQRTHTKNASIVIYRKMRL